MSRAVAVARFDGNGWLSSNGASIRLALSADVTDSLVEFRGRGTGWRGKSTSLNFSRNGWGRNRSAQISFQAPGIGGAQRP